MLLLLKWCIQTFFFFLLHSFFFSSILYFFYVFSSSPIFAFYYAKEHTIYTETFDVVRICLLKHHEWSFALILLMDVLTLSLSLSKIQMPVCVCFGKLDESTQQQNRIRASLGTEKFIYGRKTQEEIRIWDWYKKNPVLMKPW